MGFLLFYLNFNHLLKNLLKIKKHKACQILEWRSPRRKGSAVEHNWYDHVSNYGTFLFRETIKKDFFFYISAIQKTIA